MQTLISCYVKEMNVANEEQLSSMSKFETCITYQKLDTLTMLFTTFRNRAKLKFSFNDIYDINQSTKSGEKRKMLSAHEWVEQ